MLAEQRLKPEPERQHSPNGRKQPQSTTAPIQVPQATRPPEVPPEAPYTHPGLYLNRELSWIDFNWRVLALALNEDLPLLERVRFVAITASNLDEFVQKRLGGLKRQQAAGVIKLSKDGRTPAEQIELLHEAINLMHDTMTSTWEQTLKPALAEQGGVTICDYADLSDGQKDVLHRYFQEEIYSILTPLAVDPGRPFPFISNLSLSLAVTVCHPEQPGRHFVRLKIPVSRWVPVPHEGEEEGLLFLPVEQLITQHMDELLSGMKVVCAHPFRVTRNADLRRDEEEAEDLLEMISAELRERRFAPVVRLEVAQDMPRHQRKFLLQELALQEEDICEVDGLIDLTACFHIANLDLPAHKYLPWEPVVPPRLAKRYPTDRGQSIFDLIRAGDLLVHHPYESFTVSTQRLLEEAANDKQVLAIKHTLYRTSNRSPTIDALKRAGERGKHVAVLVEVKARFDEANNIEWGRHLERSGVHVAYGLVGLKTHAKATLIVRRERDGLRTYCHIGTGNYNSSTARLYTDLGYFTCRRALGRDLVNLFHFLTSFAPAQHYSKALVAPHYMREAFYELIDNEMSWQEKEGNGHIIAKMNALDDQNMIGKLYAASQEGVQIDLIVRGLCCLRPGLPGFSENIRVISHLGRFLEHDRIYYFHNNGWPRTFIGSADWRTRNLKNRVELIVPIKESELRDKLIGLLNAALADNTLAWEMQSDGSYCKRTPPADGEALNLHSYLMHQATDASTTDNDPLNQEAVAIE
jgi:polyphosphate kinase